MRTEINAKVKAWLTTAFSAITLITTLITTGCSAWSTTQPTALQPATYHCDRGGKVTVVFNEGSATLTRNNELHTLPQAPTGSGFLYTNAKISIRGKGDTLHLEIGRMAPITCTRT